MTDVVRLSSGVPRVPLRRVDDLLERIIALKIDADARAFGTLAYFLEIAQSEAELQVGRIAEEQVIGECVPDESWRPTTDRD
ncbi:hypothetical protein [Bosea sp. TAF32]|uniref:hypothetical protein n=1 Tax=Bosea sp. TAF32 TaxID=3237482 RepID=UPI003F8F7248